MRLRLALLALTACSDRPRGDAGWYWYALSASTSLEDAQAACARVRLAGARDDCQLAVLEARGAVSEDACDALDGDAWRDSCLLQVSAALAAQGELGAALDVCEGVSVARWCVVQRVDEAVTASLSEPSAAAEARLADFVASGLITDAGQQFWNLRARALVARGDAIDPRTCDGLKDPQPCTFAVGQAMRRAIEALSRRAPDQACAVARGEQPYPGTAPWVDGEPTRDFLRSWAEIRCDAEGGLVEPPRGQPPPAGRR